MSQSELLATRFSSLGLAISPTMAHSPLLGGHSSKPLPRKSGTAMENTITVANAPIVAPPLPKAMPPIPPIAAVAPFVPAYVTLDRQVLRFYAYFTEDVSGGLRRVRRFTILYYLVDGTIEISEPRVENSGLEQGQFLKRSAPAEVHAAGISPSTFAIGAAVKLCGRDFVVVDCDATTRAWLDAAGSPAAAALPFPKTTGEGAPDSRWTLVSAIGQDGQHDVHCVGSARSPSASALSFSKFQKHQGEVLCFDATFVDDTPCSSIERIFSRRTRQFKLCFFPANDTVEITEVLARPDSVSAALLKRQKLPLPAAAGSPRCGSGILPEDAAPPSAYVQAADLVCGATVDVFGRSFVLTNCDRFTRAWYGANFPALDQSAALVEGAGAASPAAAHGAERSAAVASLRAALVTETEERYVHLREAFLAADADRSGTIELAELIALCEQNHVDASAARDLVACFDCDADGKVNYEEFCALITGFTSPIETKQPAPKAFASTTRPW